MLKSSNVQFKKTLTVCTRLGTDRCFMGMYFWLIVSFL